MIKWLIMFMLLASPCWAGVDFDSVDDYIDFGVPAVVKSIANNITVFCRIKYDTDQRGDIINIWSSTGDDFKFVLLYGLTTGKLQFFVGETNCSSIASSGTSTTTMTDGVWYDVAGTFSNPNIKAYINGVEESTDTMSSNLCISDTKSLLIGASADLSATVFVDGEISECAIWDIVLTTDELLSIYNSKVKRMLLQIQPSHLVFYAPMDDEPDGSSADGDTFLDLSGNGNDGTGVDGANNTGLTAVAETVLTYP